MLLHPPAYHATARRCVMCGVATTRAGAGTRRGSLRPSRQIRHILLAARGPIMVTVKHRKLLGIQTPPASRVHPLVRFARRHTAGLLFLLPALLLFAFFVWYPIIYGFVLSFQDNSLFGGSGSCVGVGNFRRIFADLGVAVAGCSTLKSPF